MTRDGVARHEPSGEGAALAFLLDITRLSTRVGDRRLSGVDRVEAAYLRYVLARPEAVYGLARTPFGYLLLDRAGLQLLAQGLNSPDFSWDTPDILSRLARHRSPARAGVETTLRRAACARCARPGLTRMLGKAFAQGAHYINTGESNLDARVVSAIRALRQSQIDVVVHDVIPLDHPECVTPASAQRFRTRFALIAAQADRIITATAAVRDAALRHIKPVRADLRWSIAPFGLDLAQPDPGAPARYGLSGPYMVMLGTLEPRKNVAMMVDLWRVAAAHAEGDLPTLVLCGARGWYPPEFFETLSADPLYGTRIVEIGGATDAEVAGLLEGSEGLLFPSLAEGFGFPAFEAIARGVRVFCSDLPVFRETLGEVPLYLPADNIHSWLSLINQVHATPDPSHRAEITDRFTWDRHFSEIFG